LRLRRQLSGRSRHRGMIFITALGIIVVLSGMVLVFAQEMRTEALASANRVSFVQADTVELGAEQWVLANVEYWNSQTPGDAVDIVQALIDQPQGAAIPVGNGYFWLIRPLDGDTTQYDYGIQDEGGKLYLSTATENQLMAFPDMTQDVADSIMNWVATGAANPNGSDSTYYETLPEPYDAKQGPFETVDELMLVAGVTPQLLYGYDLNRDGVIDQNESTAGGTGTMFNSAGTDARGIFPYVTAYNTQPAAAGGTGGRGGGGAAKPTHLVNVNTAPSQVLQCLGLQQSDADTLVNARVGLTATDLANTTWISNAIGPAKALTLINPRNPQNSLVTTTSYQYSADIVAVSGDGRAFKRVRIVIDCQTLPAKIVYRKDLTSLGWPLPPEFRTTLRAGKLVQLINGAATSGNLGLTSK
jgi:type II secretory pathway component PulK